MQFKKPKSFILAQTEHNPDIEREFLQELGINHWNTDTNNSAQRLIELAGKTCYMSFNKDKNDNLTRVRESNNKDYIANLLKVGHGSVLEHATVTFGLTNVTCVETHEHIRHRVGTAYSQLSGRYVRTEEFMAYLPACYTPEEEAYFFESMKLIEHRHQVLTNMTFTRLEEEGKTDFTSKKELTSANRRILPIGKCSVLIFTANHRAIRHIIDLRSSEHAEEEIRYVAKLIKHQMTECFPHIYQDLMG